MRSSLEQRKREAQGMTDEYVFIDHVGDYSDICPFNWVIVKESPARNAILVARANSERDVDTYAFTDLWLRVQ